MSNCTGPILVDGSSEYETYQVYPLQVAPKPEAPGEPSSYTSTQVQFISDIQPGTRIRFDKSYIRVDCYAANVANPLLPVPVDVTKVSIPWNTPAAIFRDIEFQLNADQRSIEKYTAEFGHSNMIKILHSYTADALKDSSDKFFTPCIESTRDTTTALSTESAARAAQWLALGGAIRYTSKVIALSDIFDCMKAQSAWLANKFRLIFTLKGAAEILFQTSTATGTNKFFVTNLTLFLAMNKLSANQVDSDGKLVTSGGDIMINAYRRFEAVTATTSTSMTYDLPGVKNMQAAIAMFSSSSCSDNIGINPYQYCYGSGIVANTGVTSYQHRYGGIYSPLMMTSVSRVDKSQNTDMFQMWRLFTRLANDKSFMSPVNYGHMSLQGATDLNPYVFFTATFVNQDCAAHKQVAAMNHVVMVNGASTTGPMLVVRIRLAAVQIKGDYSITVLE